MKLTLRMLLLSILLTGFIFAQDSTRIKPVIPTGSKVSEVVSAVLIIKKSDQTYEAYKIYTPNNSKSINCKADQDFIIGNKLSAEEFKVLTDRLYVINGNFEMIDKKTGERKTLIVRGGRLIEENPSGK